MADKIERPVLEAIRIARSKMKVNRSGYNKHMNYHYPTIQDYYDAVIEPLTEVGCVLTHTRFVADNNSQLFVRTRITHTKSGDMVEDESLVISEKPGNQGQGAALTYMMKDAIRSLLALPADDDDCESERQYIKKDLEENPPASTFHIDELESLIIKTSDPAKMLGDVLRYNKVKKLNELTEEQCEKATQRVRDILRAQHEKTK